MAEIVRVIEMVRELVPDLEHRISQFEVDPFEPDEELMEAFREELERLGGDLRSGMEAAEPDEVRLAAHSIKGMASTMGLPEISVLAHEIELKSRGNDLSVCRPLTDALLNWAQGMIDGS